MQVQLRSRPRWLGFTLIELLVVIAIIAILVALLLPAVQQVREAARKSQCQDHMHNIGIGIADYENPHKQFPPGAIWRTNTPDTYAGNNGQNHFNNSQLGFGWMFHLLPFMEQKAVYDLANLNRPMSDPMDALINARVREAEIDVYQCPSDTGNTGRLNRYLSNTNRQGQWARSNYGGVLGRERGGRTGGGSAWISEPSDRRGAFGNGRSAAIRDFVDGTSNTVIVWEIRSGGHNNGDGSENNGDPRGVWALARYGASLVGGCDRQGDCWNINDGRNGAADVHGCDSKPAIGMGCWGGGDGQAAPASLHPGGAQALIGDDQVKMISENIDFNVHRALNSVNGGESVKVP